jgi:circadian clock protein KaiC
MQIEERLTIGVPGVDEILHGGLIGGRTYLIRGEPGTGKTILGLHFLQAGLDAGEAVLMVSLSEPEHGLRQNAARMGFAMDAMHVLDLTPSPEFFSEAQSYDIFSSAEVEREPVTSRIIEMVERIRPRRIYIDAITQLRYLTADHLEFRRHLFSFLGFLTQQEATVLVSSDYGSEDFDISLQFMCDGILEMRRDAANRSVSVHKFRGSGFEEGMHAARIADDGLHLFPRLVPEMHSREFVPEPLPVGVPELDEVLHGGLERGTVTIIAGPVGTGKTTLSISFARQAALHGARSVVYLFEESVASVLHRSREVGMPLDDLLAEGRLSLVPVEPLRMSADEFAAEVRERVEARDVDVVLLDGVAGYDLSLRGETPVRHLHALTRYLRNMGVTTVVVSETDWLIGLSRPTSAAISYLADNIILLQYVERAGSLRKVLSVLKKRASGFESSLREVLMDKDGIRLGPPLTDVEGVIGESQRV